MYRTVCINTQPKHLSSVFATAAMALTFCWPVPVTAASASATPTWYNVEIVVFSRLIHSAGASEHWPLKPGLPPLNKAVAISSSADDSESATNTGKPEPYSELPAKTEQLQGVWRKFKRSSGYHPLLHLAWTQPVGAGAKLKPVLIELSPKGNPVTYPAPDVPIRNLPLLGTVKLSPGRHLHLHVDLVYRAPTHNPTYPAAPRTALPAPVSRPSPRTMAQPTPLASYQSYRLNQRRALTTGNLNYFDHPVFGVIALVTPHAPQSKSKKSTSSASP